MDILNPYLVEMVLVHLNYDFSPNKNINISVKCGHKDFDIWDDHSDINCGGGL